MTSVIQPEIFEFPVNKKICFSNHKNVYEGKIKKRQLKVLTNFSPFLKQLLEPDEEILYSSKACSPVSLLEQFLTGWVLYYIKRCVLVFTNKRILHFPTKINFCPRNSVAQIRYGDIEKYKIGGFGGRILGLTYKSGKKEKFYYLESKGRKKLGTILPLFVKDALPSAVKERHHLCPRCTAPLSSGEFFCQKCRLEFKDPSQALKFSIVFPGGGYFYTRHPVLGFGDALTETILLIALIMGLVDVSKGGAQWFTVIPLAIILFLEKLITIYHARNYVKEYIPADQKLTAIQSP